MNVLYMDYLDCRTDAQRDEFWSKLLPRLSNYSEDHIIKKVLPIILSARRIGELVPTNTPLMEVCRACLPAVVNAGLCSDRFYAELEAARISAKQDTEKSERTVACDTY